MSFENNYDFEKTVQQRIIVPQIYNKIWDKLVIESDIQDNKIAKTLDYIGIDKIITNKNGNIFGLAQRIQRAKYSYYESLTIRELIVKGLDNICYYGKSEFEKTKEAINLNGITATYQSHFYANANNTNDVTGVIDGVIVDRLKLWEFIIDNPSKVKRNVTSPYENNGSLYKFQTFLFIKFDDIPLNMIIYRHKKNGLNKNLEEW